MSKKTVLKIAGIALTVIGAIVSSMDTTEEIKEEVAAQVKEQMQKEEEEAN